MRLKNISSLTGYLTNILETNIANKCCIGTSKQRGTTARQQIRLGLGLPLAHGHGTWAISVAKHFGSVSGLMSRPRTLNKPIHQHATNTFANFIDQSNGANSSGLTLLSREFSGKTDMREHDLKRAVENLTDKFMEAQELLQDAEESKDTVYFDDDLNEASEAVDETLRTYASLLDKLTEQQKQNVMRSIGLKMEELKAHQSAIVDSLKQE